MIYINNYTRCSWNPLLLYGAPTLNRGYVMFKLSQIMILGAALLLCTPMAQAAEQAQEWDLITPTGVIKQARVEPAKRITSLDGKTIALRWNGKHNGNVVLDRVAELMTKKYPTTKIIKTYVDDPGLNTISGTPAISSRITNSIAALKPDLVIASQCD